MKNTLQVRLLQVRLKLLQPASKQRTIELVKEIKLPVKPFELTEAEMKMIEMEVA